MNTKNNYFLKSNATKIRARINCGKVDIVRKNSTKKIKRENWFKKGGVYGQGFWIKYHSKVSPKPFDLC